LQFPLYWGTEVTTMSKKIRVRKARKTPSDLTVQALLCFKGGPMRDRREKRAKQKQARYDAE
jgi:hypothetical protein